MNTTPTNTSNSLAYYQHLAESPSTIRPIPRNLQMKKRWIIAKSRDNHKPQKARNLIVETNYHAILNRVKKLYRNATLPVFERNYLKDATESGLSMHAYLTNSFFFYLQCDCAFNYKVEYGFHNCPYEAQIRAWFDEYIFGASGTEVTPHPNFHTFYCNVIKAQDKKHIT